MEDEEYFDADIMLRLKEKGKLIKDTSHIFEELSKKIAVYKAIGWKGRNFLSTAVRSVHKDFKKGLRKINKKIPIFVELPTIKSVGENGMISKTYDGQASPTEFEVHNNEQQIVQTGAKEVIDLRDQP